MKIKNYIYAYSMKNLGDDLFIKIFCDRYRKDTFFLNTDKNYLNIKNIKTYRIYKVLYKAIDILTLKKYSLDDYLVKKSDKTILIGGSMFMETKQKRTIRHSLSNSNNYYIIGVNFGPYKTQEYYNYYHNLFSKAEDLCFREKYSYDLFKELPNARIAPDIVFSMDTSNIVEKKDNNKKVIISVINCKDKNLQEYSDVYENKIVEMINYFDKKQYEVCLMSFCKCEGDENAVDSILNKIQNAKLKNRIKKYYYSGNIEEAIKELNSCDVIVGTRFHANIIGMVLNKTIIPIAYSDKTINSLKDIKFNGKIIKLQDMDKYDVNSLTEKDLSYKLDISRYKKEAEKHFECLDKVFGKNNEK